MPNVSYDIDINTMIRFNIENGNLHLKTEYETGHRTVFKSDGTWLVDSITDSAPCFCHQQWLLIHRSKIFQNKGFNFD